MSSTRFSGPIKAGTIADTTGTTLGSNVANVGQVVMAQSAVVTQASGATNIVIPANSQILEITFYVTAVWSGAATTLGVGTTALATAFTAATAVNAAAIGILSVTPGTDATRTQTFIDVGTTDIKLAIASTNTGTGSAVVTVRYLQNTNLL